jgi:hypothetical protein
MSSLLDVPAQLALVLSLAAATPATEPPHPPPAAAPLAAIAAEPLEGPYAFGEGIWLRVLKEDLPKDGHGYARSIFRTSGGRYYVPRQDERRQILDARNDDALAARAARAFARANAASLRASLNRAPTAGELYLAHLFGPEAAAELIARVRARPADAAAKHVPELAKSAKDLGRVSLTLAEFYAGLTASVARAQASHTPLSSQSKMADMLQRGPAWGGLRPNAIAWQTEVSADTNGAPSQ